MDERTGDGRMECLYVRLFDRIGGLKIEKKDRQTIIPTLTDTLTHILAYTR